MQTQTLDCHIRYGLQKKLPKHYKKMFNKITVIFRVYAHNKSNWCKLVSLKWVNGVIAWIIPSLSILWCRIGHPALLHQLNTVYDKR